MACSSSWSPRMASKASRQSSVMRATCAARSSLTPRLTASWSLASSFSAAAFFACRFLGLLRVCLRLRRRAVSSFFWVCSALLPALFSASSLRRASTVPVTAASSSLSWSSTDESAAPRILAGLTFCVVLMLVSPWCDQLLECLNIWPLSSTVYTTSCCRLCVQVRRKSSMPASVAAPPMIIFSMLLKALRYCFTRGGASKASSPRVSTPAARICSSLPASICGGRLSMCTRAMVTLLMFFSLRRRLMAV
mmetsp:Transcript_32227/g.102501  ORF Transcript_32227/g.102501 Transcript_32227/m.102501 type:complete len:250 (+) Transcript_32227:1104-1853(+)